MNEFFKRTDIDPNAPEGITYEKWKEVYKIIKDIPFIEFVGDLIRGYKRELLNYKDDSAIQDAFGNL